MKSEVTKKQLLKVINQLEKYPQDRVRLVGEVAATAAGTGLGAAAAGTVAAAVGATQVTALTTAASWLGVSFLAATPVGWTIGVAAAGGALAYGVSRLVRNGALSEGRKAELLQVYKDRLQALQRQEVANGADMADKSAFASGLRELVEKEAVTPTQAFQLIEAVENGTMSLAEAYGLVTNILHTS